MRLSNAYLYELMAAGSHASGATLLAATAVGRWAVVVLLGTGVLAWLHGTRRLRADLLCVAAGSALAVALALVVRLVSGEEPVEVQVTLWWSAALGLLPCGRLAWLTFPLLTAGLGVGWCLVYVGKAFPLDVLDALPVAALGALVAGVLRHRFEQRLR